MKKATIRIEVEYDCSDFIPESHVIHSIERRGSDIVRLMNTPGSELWVTYAAQVTVTAISSNVYLDNVDVPDKFDTLGKEYIKEQVGIISDCAAVAAKTKASELDRYAIPAMQGLLTSGKYTSLCTQAYDFAEWMIAERNKRTQ